MLFAIPKSSDMKFRNNSALAKSYLYFCENIKTWLLVNWNESGNGCDRLAIKTDKFVAEWSKVSGLHPGITDSIISKLCPPSLHKKTFHLLLCRENPNIVELLTYVSKNSNSMHLRLSCDRLVKGGQINVYFTML